MAGNIYSINSSMLNRSLSGEQSGRAPAGNDVRSSDPAHIKSINASGLADFLNPADARLGKARQQAMNFIRDALAGELKIDEDMRSRNARIGELGKKINRTEEAIKDIDRAVGALREEYGVDPASQEEKDLRFLVDAERKRAKSPDVRLDDITQEKVDRIRGNMTEYQERALPLLMDRDVHLDTLKEAKTDIRVENMTVRDMTVERLKTDPIGDAWGQADAVMEAAGAEVMGMAVSGAMDHINEELEEKREEAKEAEEESRKLKERLDAAKEKREEQEELTEDILEAVSRMSVKDLDMSDPDSEINRLMSKLKLIEYDVKGAVVDEEA